MKIFSLIIILSYLYFPLYTFAQEPDLMPIPSIPETEKDAINITDALHELSENKDNTLDFCGQTVNLNFKERQKKLRNELELISRSSSVLLQRANYYFPIVEPILNENNIPEDFKYLMVVESAMNPNARSCKGAAGIWQFMKGTANDYGLQVNARIDERFQIEKATVAACRYLNDAYQRFGDWIAVAQSYNIGQARIDNELSRQQVEDVLDLDLVEETNRYIYRIFAAKIIFTNPKDFGLSDNMLYYKKMRKEMRRRFSR